MSYKCFYCGSEVIWQSDFDGEDYGYEEECIVQNFECPNCKAKYQILIPLTETEKLD